MLEFLQNLFKLPKIERPSEWQVYEANKLKSLILQEKYEKLNKINKIRLELLKSKYDDPDENFSTKEIDNKIDFLEYQHASFDNRYFGEEAKKVYDIIKSDKEFCKNLENIRKECEEAEKDVMRLGIRIDN